MNGFIETLKTALQDAIEKQEQQQNEEYNKGREDALKYALEMFEKHTPKQLPKEIEDAQKYIANCHGDIGFMGSAEYDRQKKIVDAYFEPIRQKQKDEEEKENYLRLKSKYEG